MFTWQVKQNHVTPLLQWLPGARDGTLHMWYVSQPNHQLLRHVLLHAQPQTTTLRWFRQHLWLFFLHSLFLFFRWLHPLIHGFLWWWASSRVIFYLKWHLHSSFSFSIPLQSDLKKQRNPLMKKIQGLQALHGAMIEAVPESNKH